jgi:hypothetical protein
MHCHHTHTADCYAHDQGLAAMADAHLEAATRDMLDHVDMLTACDGELAHDVLVALASRDWIALEKLAPLVAGARWGEAERLAVNAHNAWMEP